MDKVTAALRTFVRDEEGATMAEYALLLALIALLVIGAARTLGNQVGNSLNNTAEKIQNASAAPTT